MEDSAKEDKGTERCDSLLVGDELRKLILRQLASAEPSNVSDEDDHSVRLSCILEDDEGDSSGSQGRSKAFPKKETVARKMGERDKPGRGPSAAEKNKEDSESRDDAATPQGDCAPEDVPVTDLDESPSANSDGGRGPSEKTETQRKTDEEESAEMETEEEDDGKARNSVPFAIKKLKSSDNIFEGKFVPKRTEFSSDSSDIDISISNEKPIDVAVVEAAEDDAIETPDSGMIRDVRDERADSEELQNHIFPRVSKAYLEKAKSREEVKDEGDSRGGSVERELLNYPEEEDPKLILQIVQLRSRSPRVYTPPVPPETYLWEELKRIRCKGGYPWTYLDKPPFDEAVWKKYMEHEYEPINPPPLTSLRRQEKQPDKVGKLIVSDVLETDRHNKQVPHSVEEAKNVNENEMNEGNTAAVAEEVKTPEDMEIERLAAAQELQEEAENRYLAQTPTTTTASRTDCDVNTSMLDSSGLEDIPLKKGSRSKLKSQAHGIHQKLRNQAGKIRSKIRNIPKPTLIAKDRPKNGGTQEKLRFKMPERPKFTFPDKAKFTLPDRPKFKLPDRPKFNLPERPKFHLPEKPKFSLPDRPKFNLPERPRFHLPEKPKFSLPDRPKFNLPERPKLHLPERPKFNLPEVSKLHLPDRSKFHLPEKAKINLPSFVRPLRERQATSPRRNLVEIDFKNYPKIFSKKSWQRREFMTSSPKKTRGSTPPPKMTSEQPSAPERKKVPVGQRWLKKMDDIKYADEEMSLEVKESRKSDGSDSLFDFKDKDLGGFMEDLDESTFPAGGRKTLSTKSSMSHMSDRDIESLASSEGRLRKGVLEEIDSDEFFLRQKGISQEDIDMGKYLSHEIREAFRSPEVNALTRMSYDYDEVEEENRPSRPSRARPTKKSSLKKQFESDPALNENSEYKTYSPSRPSRKSRSQSKSLVNEEEAVAELGPTYENEPRAYPVEEYYKIPGPATEYQHYKVPRPIWETTPIPHKRKKTGKKKLGDAISAEMSVEKIDQCPPQTTTTLTMGESKSLDGGQETAGNPIPEEESEIPEKCERKEEEPATEEAPTPPRRTRSLSRESRSVHSSRSLRSVGLDESRDAVDLPREPPQPERVEALVESQSSELGETPRPHHYEMTEDDPGFGYATIGKPTVKRPSRKKEKLQRPPPPRRKREIASLFNTVPRRIPVRPMRNYSTLGPSRPPRKGKIRSASRVSHNAYHVQEGRNDVECESIIKPLRYEECHDSNKDLQKEEVIERMKGRPLPPPPRPPRQKSKGQEDFQETEESEEAKISMALLKGEAIPVEVEALIHAPPPDAADVEEVCASTQTDPLPDDFLLDMEVDVIQEFSHEQLQIQQAFLEEMKREENVENLAEGSHRAEAESPEDKQRVNEILEMELLAELKKDAEQQEPQIKTDHLEPFDKDLGYASLDRRQHKQEQPEPSTSDAVLQAIHVPVIPDVSTTVKVLRTDKLDVRELEVEKLNVKQVQAQGLQVSSLETGHVTADAVNTRSGNLLLENIELPPRLIQQVVERIPWNELRPSVATPAVRRPESDDENLQGSPRSAPRRHRRHRQPAYSSDEEKRHEEGRPHRRHMVRAQTPSPVELSRQLATACAASGIRAMQDIALRIQNAQLQDKALLMRVVLCVVILLVAGFLLLGYDSKTVLHHHWEFQFPPQPPPHQFF